jgi:hypothetical protein
MSLWTIPRRCISNKPRIITPTCTNVLHNRDDWLGCDSRHIQQQYYDSPRFSVLFAKDKFQPLTINPIYCSNIPCEHICCLYYDHDNEASKCVCIGEFSNTYESMCFALASHQIRLGLKFLELSLCPHSGWVKI